MGTISCTTRLIRLRGPSRPILTSVLWLNSARAPRARRDMRAHVLPIAPHFFPVDKRAEAAFEGLGMCCSEHMSERRKVSPAIPALNETVDFISAADTGTGVTGALSPGIMMRTYVDNVIHPVIAMALGKGTARALADAEPNAVA
eukprot:12301569-Alexandrium_andersonii.AAC.1